MAKCFSTSASFILAAALSLAAVAPLAQAQQAPDKAEGAAPTVDAALAGADKIGDGVVTAYAKDGKTLLLLPKAAFERLFLWYAEYVAVPTGVVGYLPLGGVTVQLQHREGQVFVRNLTDTFAKRVGGKQDPRPGQEQGYEINPIALSVRRSNEPPIIAVLPVVASASDGSVLVDVTGTFSNDIETMSARALVLNAELVPVQVNPKASYITSVRVFPQNFGVRVHLTFVAKHPTDPSIPPRNVSMRIGHSLVMLPEEPMKGRPFDPRVGFFYTGGSVLDFMKKYTEYEAEGGEYEKVRALAMRYRLEKKDPQAKVSDPVEPIVFYVGREVPERWRPAIKSAIEMWRPAFRAAGFSNAIVARDAPSFAEDPNWTAEDARHSTIRWLAQPNANARGPHIVDPRSGEILSSHVEVWPQVITIFSRYYFAIYSSLDERAKTLPLPQDVQEEILRYAVAHEVGHAIGLRHNHLASTAYSVAQMRNADFANKWGANASIMAYGRFNQAAQPGDGVAKFIPDLGPYDYFAINWGYGVHGATPDEERLALDAMATRALSDRTRVWGAGELPEEKAHWALDPRVLKENTGAERVEATRLGVANVLRSLHALPGATDDDEEFIGAFEQLIGRHTSMLKSVATLLAGVESSPWTKSGARARVVPAAQQREAVEFLLGDAARSLEDYRTPEVATRASVTGVDKLVESMQASLLNELFDGTKLVLLEAQKAADPTAYGVLEFAGDSYRALWGDLSSAPQWRRPLQRAYFAKLAEFFTAEDADPALRAKKAEAYVQGGFSQAFAATAAAGAADTVFPAWARRKLPTLAERLEVAAEAAGTPEERFHFYAMAQRARAMARKHLAALSGD